METQKTVEFGELVRAHFDTLTLSEKHIANYLLGNPNEAAFLSATELAACLGLSEATVAQFARSLGFRSFPDMCAALQVSFRSRTAVFFDMGGTIETFWHDRELRMQATPELRRLLERAGIHLNLTAEELYTAVTQGLARYRRWSMHFLIELPPKRVWREYILADYPVAPYQLDAIAEELSFFVETRYYQREMRPEMPAILEAIHKLGLRMGVISNVQSRGQVPANLKQYGILHYFDPIVLSSVYGRRKPDPSIFHHAARLAGVPANMCVYVGDRISRDILGARRAGYRLAIQIRHRFDADDGDSNEGPAPDAVLNDMTELVGILETELRRSTAGA